LNAIAARRADSSYGFWILILVIIVAGLSQGLLLPLLTILLDQKQISPELNGFNSSALYIGIFCTMFIIEKPVQRFGYKPVIGLGIVLVTVATLLFPMWQNIGFWFVLRLMVGIGDSALHYATQLWIVTNSSKERRGRNISMYGMAYGIGFSIGPLGINLLNAGTWVPFLVVAFFFILVLILLLRLNNEYPERGEKGQALGKRSALTIQMAWFALIPSFIFGYMESTMNSNFPLYGLRLGFDDSTISLLLPTLGIGALLLQLPLGLWSDRIGRKPVLITAGILGAATFLAVPLAGDRVWLIALLLAVAGGMVGSFFSLGLAYAADILPKALIPKANVIGSINYSLGSIIGPTLGGFCILYLTPSSIFYLLGSIFLVFACLGITFKRTIEKLH
jgi:MFS family permease